MFLPIFDFLLFAVYPSVNAVPISDVTSANTPGFLPIGFGVTYPLKRPGWEIFKRQVLPSDCEDGVACTFDSTVCCASFVSCCGSFCCADGFSCTTVSSGSTCCTLEMIGSGTCGSSGNGGSSNNPCGNTAFAPCPNANWCCPSGSICYVDSFGTITCGPVPSSSQSFVIQDESTTFTPTIPSTTEYTITTPYTEPTTTTTYDDIFTSTSTTHRYTSSSLYFVTEPGVPAETSPAFPTSSNAPPHLSTGVIVGIAVGSTIFLIILLIGIICCCRGKKPDPEGGADRRGQFRSLWQQEKGEDFELDSDPVGQMDEAKIRQAFSATLDALDKDQTEFLNMVENAVYNLVISHDAGDCSAIRETRNGVVKRISAKSPIDWTKRLYSMARQRSNSSGTPNDNLPTYEGATLDSWLSPKILETVQKQTGKFFTDRADVIGNGLSLALHNDPYLRTALAKQLADAIQKSGKPLTKKLYKGLRHSLENAIHTVDGATIALGHTLGHSVAGTVLSSLSASILHALGKALAKIVAHHSLANLTHAIAAHAGKFVITHVIIGGLVSAGAQHFFHKSAAALAGPAMPIILGGLMIWQYNRFPRKMAEEVAPAVRRIVAQQFREPGKSFRAQNESALMMIVTDAVAGGCKKLAKGMLDDAVEGIPLVEKSIEAAKGWVEDEGEEYLERKFPRADATYISETIG